MKKRMHWLLLTLVCCALVLPGCRRKPIETETQTETQSETESETESKTEKAAKKESEKQSETNKRKTVSPNSSTSNAPRTPSTNQKQSETQAQSETTAPTEAPAQEYTYNTCPYCGGSFSTNLLDDGTSEYSNHVAQEEAYIDYINGTSGNTNSNSNTNPDYDSSDDGGQFDSTGQYGQCNYCFQWFSTVPDASGYSPYANHVAAEEAYAMQNSHEKYLLCPNCGNWVTQSDYNDHIANGW